MPWLLRDFEISQFVEVSIAPTLCNGSYEPKDIGAIVCLRRHTAPLHAGSASLSGGVPNQSLPLMMPQPKLVDACSRVRKYCTSKDSPNCSIDVVDPQGVPNPAGKNVNQVCVF